MLQYRSIRIRELSQKDREYLYGASRLSLFQKPGELGREYLTEKRGLDVETISDFRLGFVPFDVDHCFSGRIVIPIFDPYSNLIALSVRGVTDDCEPKYWNESYPKGETLFGMHNAMKSIWEKGYAIIVEGQFDVIAMHAFGFSNTVGILGGAFTPMHAYLLKRYTHQIVFMFDGDEAGLKHNERANELMLAFNTGSYFGHKSLSHCFTTLPTDSDPDSFLKDNGAQGMKKLIDETMSKSGLWERN